MRAGWSLLVAFLIAGCVAPPDSATEAALKDEEGMTLLQEPGIAVNTTEYTVDITSMPPNPDTKLVTYFILRPDNTKMVFQVSATGYDERFPISMPRKKFYRGNYIIRAHENSDPKPFKEIEYLLDGVSISDEWADRLQ